MWKKFVICTTLIFLFTLKFELINNVIAILILFALKDELKLLTSGVVTLALIVLFLVPFYFFYFNNIYLKYIIYGSRLLVILFILRRVFSNTSNRYILNLSLELVYYTHVGAIILCYIFPQVNNVFRELFSYSTGSDFRISGFIQGYEFVPFIVLIYLAYEFKINGDKLSKNLFFKLVLGGLCILLSGRFGFIPLSFFLSWIFVKNFYILKFSFIVSLGFVLSGFLEDQIMNIINTGNLVLGMLSDIENLELHQYNDIKRDGQYNLSPLTWYYEFRTPFENWIAHIFPGDVKFVDSGPSFLLLNFGFIVTIFLYIMYFRAINMSVNEGIPIFVVIIILLVDLKFRLLYTLMPSVWLLVNHVNYKFNKQSL